jgi:hypothetical protein
LRQSLSGGAGGVGCRGGLSGGSARGGGGTAGSLPRLRGGAVRQSVSPVVGAASLLAGASSGGGSGSILAEGRGGFQPTGFWCHGLSACGDTGTLGSAGKTGTTSPTEPDVWLDGGA